MSHVLNKSKFFSLLVSDYEKYKKQLYRLVLPIHLRNLNNQREPKSKLVTQW